MHRATLTCSLLDRQWPLKHYLQYEYLLTFVYFLTSSCCRESGRDQPIVMAVGPHSQGGGKLALDTSNVIAEATGNPIAAIIRGSQGPRKLLI
jgi:hypothetical protein